MKFFEPWGLLALIGVPIIILLYLLKQKYNNTTVSSLFLWKAALCKAEAQKPWQKLKKNILMAFQIFAVILLAFALANPFILGKTQQADYILALDCSMSMQSTDISPSRFEAAKAEIKKMVENAPPDTGFSLIQAGETPLVLMGQTTRKSELLNALAGTKPTLGTVNWEDTAAFLDARQKQYGGDIYIFSDTYPTTAYIKASYSVFAQSGENSAITNISHNQADDGYQILVQVKNFGEASTQRTVTLFCDDVVFDLEEITLEPKEQKDVVFSGIPLETKAFSARITPEDILTADDVHYNVAGQGSKNKILLVTEGNVFLEKALSLLPNIELYKASPDNIENIDGYALYIFDGVLPETMPASGHTLVFNLPEENPFIETISLNEKPITVRGEGNGRLSFMEDVQFSVKKPNGILAPPWGQKILDYGGNAIAIAGEQAGKKLALFSFDLNESDFPLKMEFPIMLYHLTEWYFPTSSVAIENKIVEQPISFDLLPSTKNAQVVLPSQDTLLLAEQQPAPPFENTSQAGVYTLLQYDENGVGTENLFAVNTNATVESDIAPVSQTPQEVQAEQAGVQKSKSLQGSILILLLLLLLIEWRVSLYEN